MLSRNHDQIYEDALHQNLKRSFVSKEYSLNQQSYEEFYKLDLAMRQSNSPINSVGTHYKPSQPKANATTTNSKAHRLQNKASVSRFDTQSKFGPNLLPSLAGIATLQNTVTDSQMPYATTSIKHRQSGGLNQPSTGPNSESYYQTAGADDISNNMKIVY